MGGRQARILSNFRSTVSPSAVEPLGPIRYHRRPDRGAEGQEAFCRDQQWPLGDDRPIQLTSCVQVRSSGANLERFHQEVRWRYHGPIFSRLERRRSWRLRQTAAKYAFAFEVKLICSGALSGTEHASTSKNLWLVHFSCIVLQFNLRLGPGRPMLS